MQTIRTARDLKRWWIICPSSAQSTLGSFWNWFLNFTSSIYRCQILGGQRNPRYRLKSVSHFLSERYPHHNVTESARKRADLLVLCLSFILHPSTAPNSFGRRSYGTKRVGGWYRITFLKHLRGGISSGDEGGPVQKIAKTHGKIVRIDLKSLSVDLQGYFR